MTKTEQRLLTRVRAKNDRGLLSGRPVERKLEKSARRFGGMTRSGPEIKSEAVALYRLIDMGELIYTPHAKEFGSGYVVKDHPLLSKVANNIDLFAAKKKIEDARIALAVAEEELQKLKDFVLKYGKNE